MALKNSLAYRGIFYRDFLGKQGNGVGAKKLVFEYQSLWKKSIRSSKLPSFLR